MAILDAINLALQAVEVMKQHIDAVRENPDVAKRIKHRVELIEAVLNEMRAHPDIEAMRDLEPRLVSAEHAITAAKQAIATVLELQERSGAVWRLHKVAAAPALHDELQKADDELCKTTGGGFVCGLSSSGVIHVQSAHVGMWKDSKLQ